MCDLHAQVHRECHRSLTSRNLQDCDRSLDGILAVTEFMLYLLDDDFYLVLRKELPWTTTLTLSSPRIRDFKNNWDMLKG
jgi:hypothetical protein